MVQILLNGPCTGSMCEKTNSSSVMKVFYGQNFSALLCVLARELLTSSEIDLIPITEATGTSPVAMKGDLITMQAK